MFLPGQGPLEVWVVSASGNNTFKVAFIRWTLKKKRKKKPFKAVLKKICQVTWLFVGVCMGLCGWVMVWAVDGRGRFLAKVSCML